MKNVLIVEDDVNLGTTLAGVLESHDYKVKYLSGGEKVMEELQCFKPDVVLMDIMLNEELDGFDLCKQIRTVSQVPVLFTTSREGNDDFATGFSIDNTDYVRKPYKVMEILMRIQKILSAEIKSGAFTIGNFSFFPGEQSLRYDCNDIRLNNYESAVLTLLCKNLGNFVAKKDITEQVWNEPDPKLKEGSLNNILTTLRKYLQKDPKISLEVRIKLGVRLLLAE